MLGHIGEGLKSFNTTTALAIWGAFLSSVTFGWNLLRDLRDKAKAEVTARIANIVVRADGSAMAVKPELLEDNSQKLFAIISMVNVGRRPLRMAGIGGYYKTPVNGKEGFVFNARHLPKTLTESEAHDKYGEFDGSFRDGNIKKLYVWDTTGKKWALSGWELRKFIKECKHYAKTHPPPEGYQPGTGF